MHLAGLVLLALLFWSKYFPFRHLRSLDLEISMFLGLTQGWTSMSRSGHFHVSTLLFFRPAGARFHSIYPTDEW